MDKPHWMEHYEVYESNDGSDHGREEAEATATKTLEGNEKGNDNDDDEEMKQRNDKTESHDNISNNDKDGANRNFQLHLQLNTEIASIKRVNKSDQHQDQSQSELEIKLTNGKTLHCDLLLCAMGVLPYTPYCDPKVLSKTSKNGALIVNEFLQARNYPHIFAAGDCCKLESRATVHEKGSDDIHAWFQMQLWSQAQQMGWIAAHAMFYDPKDYENDVHLCFNWELFAHVTKFFNKKCIFLGRFNGQGLRDSEFLKYNTKMKMELEKQQMIKLVVEVNEYTGRERVMGAVLIGDTGLEETCENLILNKTDISKFGDDFLSVDVDLEDMFD
ncbi:hypothetical protein RFI_09768 [Reticulomyxa filosa]|uniref:FAD/NAD(P)-binding domain-containing protein n=1 Tax=Reticulomyxa filosa TaxID=46433 RepID=X6NPU9_RETFI|nr:hypothetical protein RFI_09768 [Reticulomyxa filosa]|eukprot:ETO27367.1 hypothetical protein RFI_09768 [Reticulomyxa filosa]